MELSFKEVQKTFESCGLKLKIPTRYQNVFESCGLKHDKWEVRIKDLLKKESKTNKLKHKE